MREILVLDREFGAGASTIGGRLARQLNWRLFDDELTREIASLARIPVDVCRRHEERVDPWLRRLVNVVWRGTFDRNLPSPDLAILDTDRLVRLIEQAVQTAARSKPCVIVGRGAPYFLRGRADTLCVFLYASRELRFRRVLRRVGGDKHEAVELVDQVDEDRKKFVKHHLGYEWPNRQLFHVMLNTGIGDDQTVESILRLLDTVNQSDKGTHT
ncbi:MAG TPA: cytidylate kinase-like family protein [Steroidobacteraceae bacterium]|jgi:cytidylate kinase|nr:cytidylate kinase-like family protein [Steroidobacteraceae bacterium]